MPSSPPSFTSTMAIRHAPTISFTSSLDCDAVVRTSTTFATAHDLVSYALSTHSQLQQLQLISAKELPPLGLHATRALQSALESASNDVTAVTSFADALESVTAVARHTHLRDPVISLHASWVAQPGFSPPPADDDNAHLLLFVRTASRHDDAALSNALPVSLDQLGHDRVHVVRLPQKEKVSEGKSQGTENNEIQLSDKSNDENNGNESIVAVAVRIVELVRKLADLRTDKSATAADRARRATRTSFRSWLLGTSSSQTPLLLHEDMSPSIVSASSSNASGSSSMSSVPAKSMASNATISGTPMSYASSSTSPTVSSTHSRRGSFRAALQAPQFDPSSAESISRRHADYAFVAGRYGEAADAYAQLAVDCRSLTGLAAVHEASAHEMTGLSRAMIPAPPLAVTPSFERAIAAYTRAVRPELAVRVAFRAAALLTPNSPDQAISFLLRTRDAIAPATGATASATGSAFVDIALAIIAVKCAHLFLLRSPKYCSKRRPSNRRASMYAFIAMTRLSALGYDLLAGRLADLVAPSATLGRPAVDHYVTLAHANAAVANGNVRQAISLFSSALSSVSENTDVELQGSTVRSFIRFIGDGIAHRLPSTWDGGAPFPLMLVDDTRVITVDHNPDESLHEKQDWARLEDDVLEDWEWVRQLSKKKRTAKRERRPETIVTELRRKPAKNQQEPRKNIGGSLEMKIHRIREVAKTRRKAIRVRSLLTRSAVVGESVVLRVALNNPLQFPIFVDDVCAAVTLDGQLHFRHSFNSDSNSNFNLPNFNFNPDSTYPNSKSSSNSDSDEPTVTLLPLHGVVLKPAASQTVDLHVVPNTPGSLRFIGVTWRFTIGMGPASPRSSSAVPGFALLNKRGPRLNRTRKQRAADPPMYEEDVSLLLRVVSDAPRISAVLKHHTKTKQSENEQLQNTRAGEITRVHLILKNTGNLPVNEITLRVAAPYDVFVDVPPVTMDGKEAPKLVALGADDLPISHCDSFVSVTTKIDLPVGATIELPAWIRTSVPNSAFSRRYRNSYGVSSEGVGVTWRARIAVAYGTEQARVARAQIRANVLCSLSASPRFMREADVPAFGSGVLLGVEVEHAGRGNDVARFDVTRINVASCSSWKVRPLPAPNVPTGKPPKEIAPAPSTLVINETATVFTFIVRDLPHNGETVERDWQCHGVSVGVDSDEIDPKKDADAQLAARHFLLCKRHSWHVLPAGYDSGEWAFVAIQWQDPNGAIGDIHLSPMDPTRWVGRNNTHSSNTNTANSTSVANDTISQPPVSTTTTISSTNSSDDPPVLVQVTHASEVEHDFSQDPLLKRPVTKNNHVFPATVDVKVAITNISRGLVDVMLSAPPVGGIADGDRGRHWAGDVAISLRSLPPRATRVVNLTAVLVAPGSFNVARFAVVVQSAGFRAARPRHLVKIPASFVIVKEKAGKKIEFTLIQ